MRNLISSANNLAKYLQKREFVVPPVPECIPFNDFLIKEFNSNFESESKVKNHVTTENSVTDDMTMAEPTVIDAMAAVKLPRIKIQNLLFRIKEEELIHFGKKFGIEFRHVELLNDQSTGKPNGSAIVHLDANQVVSEACSKLTGEDCLGRIVRAYGLDLQHQKTDSSSAGNRYFETDISFKCHNCGCTGHRSNDCTNPQVVVPCHLCGSNSHEPGDCTSLVCFRCNKFGHHSRNCSYTRRTQRSLFCTFCGATDHANFQCEVSQLLYSRHKNAVAIDHILENANNRFVSPESVCSLCFNSCGHTICSTFDIEHHNENSRLYCPNCGESGHHVDYPPAGMRNPCRAARHEAYIKFNQLMDCLLDPLHGGQTDETSTELYRSLTRYQSDNVLQLFPPLQAPLPPIHFSRKQTDELFQEKQFKVEYCQYDSSNNFSNSNHNSSNCSGSGSKRSRSEVDTQFSQNPTKLTRGNAFDHVSDRERNGNRDGGSGHYRAHMGNRHHSDNTHSEHKYDAHESLHQSLAQIDSLQYPNICRSAGNSHPNRNRATDVPLTDRHRISKTHYTDRNKFSETQHTNKHSSAETVATDRHRSSDTMHTDRRRSSVTQHIGQHKSADTQHVQTPSSQQEKPNSQVRFHSRDVKPLSTDRNDSSSYRTTTFHVRLSGKPSTSDAQAGTAYKPTTNPESKLLSYSKKRRFAND